jgi:hypothetical protein
MRFCVPDTRIPGYFGVLAFFAVLLTTTTLKGEGYTVELRYYKATYHLPGYFIEKVISTQSVDSCIGFVQVGQSDKKVAAFFYTRIANEISLFLNNSIVREPGTKPLILQVNRLRIYEMTYAKAEISVCQLNLSFLEKSDTGYIELFNSSAEIHRYGVDVTTLHEVNIATAFDSCFSAFNNRSLSGTLAKRQIPAEQFGTDPLEDPSYYPIFRDSPKKGIYRSFYDFRENTPDPGVLFQVIPEKNFRDSSLRRVVLRMDNKKLKNQLFWGFSDGTLSYVRVGKKYYALAKQKKEFDFSAYIEDFTPDAASANWGAIVISGVMFGMIGAGVATAVVTSSPTHHSPHFPVKLKIDFYSGTPFYHTEPDFLKNQGTCIFHFSKTAPRNSSLCLFTDGKFCCMIKPGEYFEKQTARESETLDLKLVPDGQPAFYEKLSAPFYTTQVYLIKIKKDKSISVSKLYDQVKTDILNKMTAGNTVKTNNAEDIPESCGSSVK